MPSLTSNEKACHKRLELFILTFMGLFLINIVKYFTYESNLYLRLCYTVFILPSSSPV